MTGQTLNHPKTIGESPISVRENMIPTRENFHFFAREKKNVTREKIFKRVREKS